MSPANRFFHPRQHHDPRSLFSLPDGENGPDAGGVADFDAILAESRAAHRCAECSSPLERWQWASSSFCSPKCRYRFRDRRRYAENPEAARERARAYYRANREAVLEKAAARRGKVRPSEPRSCSECLAPLEPPKRVVCSGRCREARFRRLRPEAYAAREARKVERRREKRRLAREAP